MKEYYNTTNETGTILNKSYKKANSQQKAILNYFIKYKQGAPSEIWLKMQENEDIKRGSLLTSVRRSITNLTKEGHLIKTAKKQNSVYGKPEYIWKLV